MIVLMLKWGIILQDDCTDAKGGTAFCRMTVLMLKWDSVL